MQERYLETVLGGHFTGRVEGEQSAQVGDGEMAEQWRKMGRG